MTRCSVATTVHHVRLVITHPSRQQKVPPRAPGQEAISSIPESLLQQNSDDLIEHRMNPTHPTQQPQPATPAHVAPIAVPSLNNLTTSTTPFNVGYDLLVLQYILAKKAQQGAEQTLHDTPTHTRHEHRPNPPKTSPYSFFTKISVTDRRSRQRTVE